MDVYISAIGTATPHHQVKQADACENALAYLHSAKRERSLKALYAKSAIDSRATILHAATALASASEMEFQYHLPLPTSNADRGPSTSARMRVYEAEIRALGAAACQASFDQYGERLVHLLPSIGSLVTVSCTGFSAPGLDIGLIEEFSLSSSIERHHIGFMGCHGAINGLRAARALTQTNNYRKRTLLCAAELCSIHFQYGDETDNVLANCLFADGAAAAIITTELDDDLEMNGVWRMRGFGSYLLPESKDLMSWKVGDNGFVMTLSSRVADVIRDGLRHWVTEWLASFGLDIQAVNAWAVHPGGPKILDAVQEALGLDGAMLAPSREILRQRGNMSSPTVLFILERIAQMKANVPVVVMAFGPGLTIEAMLLESVGGG